MLTACQKRQVNCDRINLKIVVPFLPPNLSFMMKTWLGGFIVKKIAGLVLSIALMMNVCWAAAEMSVMPMAQVETTLRAYISTSGSIISGRGKCSSLPGYTSTVCVYIQKCMNGSWVTVSSNLGTGVATASATMESGYSYRVYTTCTVYDAEGGYFDSENAYSSTVTY